MSGWPKIRTFTERYISIHRGKKESEWSVQWLHEKACTVEKLYVNIDSILWSFFDSSIQMYLMTDQYPYNDSRIAQYLEALSNVRES